MGVVPPGVLRGFGVRALHRKRGVYCLQHWISTPPKGEGQWFKVVSMIYLPILPTYSYIPSSGVFMKCFICHMPRTSPITACFVLAFGPSIWYPLLWTRVASDLQLR